MPVGVVDFALGELYVLDADADRSLHFHVAFDTVQDNEQIEGLSSFLDVRCALAPVVVHR